MRKLLSMVGALAMLGAVALSGCGKSKCDELKDICAKCTGVAAIAKATCEAVANSGNEDACKPGVDAYSQTCK